METIIHNPKVLATKRFKNFDIVSLSDGEGVVTVFVDRKCGKPATQLALAILDADVVGYD